MVYFFLFSFWFIYFFFLIKKSNKIPIEIWIGCAAIPVYFLGNVSILLSLLFFLIKKVAKTCLPAGRNQGQQEWLRPFVRPAPRDQSAFYAAVHYYFRCVEVPVGAGKARDISVAASFFRKGKIGICRGRCW